MPYLKPAMPEFLKPKPVAPKPGAKKIAQSRSEKQQTKKPANTAQAPKTGTKGKENSGAVKLAPRKKTWTAPVKDRAVLTDNKQLAAGAATDHKSANASDAACKRPSRAQKINYAEFDDSDGESTNKPISAEVDVAAAPEVFSCKECGDQFTVKELLDNHRRRKHMQRPRGKHQCAYCPYSSNKRDHVASHERIHTGERPFLCHVCGRGFNRRQHLKSHLLVHTKEKPYECRDCGQRFAQAPILARHRREQHSGDSARRHACPECRKEFTRRSNLTTHMLTHTGEKPHACCKCGKRFARRGVAKQHEQVVHGRHYPIHCPHCGKVLWNMRDLRSHVRARHNDEYDDDQ